MAWVTVEKKRFGPSADPLGDGQVSVQKKSGTATFRAADLALVNITDKAVVMADADRFLIAIRAPRDGETDVYAVRGDAATKKNDNPRRLVNVMQAIKQLGMTADKVAGRYDCQTKDGLIWWCVADLTADERKKANAPTQPVRPRFEKRDE